jgi:5-deoxy-D-glucuronate isomerase
MKGDKVIRWDNVPHHNEISTYPDHKHENDKIKESTKMVIDRVLEEIENFSFTKF